MPDIDAAALDALVDALMTSREPVGRAEVVCAVLEELFAAVTWIQTTTVDPAETASLHDVLVAADRHRRRMSLVEPGTPAVHR